MIQLKHVSVRAQEGLLLRDITLGVKAYEAISLYGPSGGGKSTLLQLLLGGYRWNQGQYLFMGEAVNEGNIQRLRQTIAYIPQLPDLGSGIVQDYIKGPFQWRGLKKQNFDHDQLLILLDRLELQSSLLQADASHLSGGQRQRIAIVRALMTERKVIVADEPTSALDGSSGKAVCDLLLSGDYTVISASHDPKWIAQCRRTLKIADGQLAVKSSDPLQAAS